MTSPHTVSTLSLWNSIVRTWLSIINIDLYRIQCFKFFCQCTSYLDIRSYFVYVFFNFCINYIINFWLWEVFSHELAVAWNMGSVVWSTGLVILSHVGLVPRPRIKPMLAGSFSTTGPSGKPYLL